MKDIKAGTVVIMKTSGEPMLVLGTYTEEVCPYGALTGKGVIVRRPLQGEQGITYKTDKFYVEEVETADEAKEKALSEFMQVRAQAGASDPNVVAALSQAKSSVGN